MARPKGTTKLDSLVQADLTLRVDQETWEWYKALPKGTKAKILREAISLYRNQNKPENLNNRDEK